jgi:hypothetical protein
VGANDPFRIKTGAMGCWFKTAKRGTAQGLMSKYSGTGRSYYLSVNASNYVEFTWSLSGSDWYIFTGVTDVADDRWHFAVGIMDGMSIRIYVDGVLEALAYLSNYLIFGGPAPFNIGGQGADASTATSVPFFGRIDEAFITSDIPTEDQVRNLYYAKLTHTLAAVPSRVSLSVKRRRRGVAFSASDFPSAPLRLYNFSAGSYADEGSNATPLLASGTLLNVAGADGSAGNGMGFSNPQTSGNLYGTDAGLPTGLAAQSIGFWFKAVAGATQYMMSWGSASGTDVRIWLDTSGGTLNAMRAADNIVGPSVRDNQWHFVVVTEDNTALDGVKRKLYLDGVCVGNSVTVSAIALGGGNNFRLGSYRDGTSGFFGQLDGVFVCGYALTYEQIRALYNKSSQTLASSPKNSGDHIEAMSSNTLLATFDALDSTAQIDLKVAA